ncbi:MAG TPA: DNA alkylation repair protein [Actinomycetota bacterium]|nr:DNA alkylation repair protein [Actinomycetota bacterium]
MTVDVATEADAITAALRALAPEPTVVPVIKTARPFYGARVGDLRATAGGWLRGHPDATPAQVAGLADRLWQAGIREEQLVACFLLAGDGAALAATDPARVATTWTALLDNWETTDQLGMNVLGPLVALDPGARFGLLRAMAGDRHPWTRRVALVACTRLARADGAARLWPQVAELLLGLAGDREAALPKASSWVLRSWLQPCPSQVAAFVDRYQGRLPALAVRETRAKLATGTKRPPPRPGGRRPAPAGGRR